MPEPHYYVAVSGQLLEVVFDGWYRGIGNYSIGFLVGEDARWLAIGCCCVMTSSRLAVGYGIAHCGNWVIARRVADVRPWGAGRIAGCL